MKILPSNDLKSEDNLNASIGNWFNKLSQGFPGGPVAKVLCPVLGAQVPSLLRELGPPCHNQNLAQPSK